MADGVGVLADIGTHVASVQSPRSCKSEPRSGNEAWPRKGARVRHDLTAPADPGDAESGRERRRLLRAVRARVMKRALSAGWRRRAGVRPGLAPGASTASTKRTEFRGRNSRGTGLRMLQPQGLRSNRGGKHGSHVQTSKRIGIPLSEFQGHRAPHAAAVGAAY